MSEQLHEILNAAKEKHRLRNFTGGSTVSEILLAEILIELRSRSEHERPAAPPTAEQPNPLPDTQAEPPDAEYIKKLIAASDPHNYMNRKMGPGGDLRCADGTIFERAASNPLPDTQAEQSGHEYLLTENLRAAILLAEMREIPTRVTLARWRQLVEHAASTTAHTDLKEKGGDAT